MVKNWIGEFKQGCIVRAQIVLNDEEGQKTLPLQKSSKKSIT